MSRPNSKKDKIYAELIIAALLTYINWTPDTLERPIIQNFTWRPLKDDHGFRFKVTPDVIIDIIRACNQIPHFRQLENKNLTVFTKCGTTAVKKRGKPENLYDNIRDAISTLHKYNLIQEKQERKQGYSCQVRDFTIKLPYPITNQNQLKTYLQNLFATGKDWDSAADEYKLKSKFKKLGTVESETIDPNLSIIQTGIKGICHEIVQVAQKLPSELTAYTLEYRNHLQTQYLSQITRVG